MDRTQHNPSMFITEWFSFFCKNIYHAENNAVWFYINVTEHVPTLKAYILQRLFFLIKLSAKQVINSCPSELPIILLRASHKDTLLMLNSAEYITLPLFLSLLWFSRPWGCLFYTVQLALALAEARFNITVNTVC